MRGIVFGFGLVLLMVGIIAVVTTIPEDGTESGTDPVPADQERGAAEIRGREFRPATIRAIGGTTFTVRNRTDEPHGVRFERGRLKDVDRIAPGQVGTIELSADGRFPFVCPIHPEMKGTLVVEKTATS